MASVLPAGQRAAQEIRSGRVIQERFGPNLTGFTQDALRLPFNRFQAKLDEAIRSGRPDPRLVDYINDFDFQREFQDSSSFGGRAAPIQRVIRQ